MAIADLPEYPWDTLAPAAAVARAHPDGIVDLSVGDPVDPTPEVVQRAAAAAVDAHSYPHASGTAALLDAIVRWYARRRNVPGLTPAHVLPTTGSKELVALLPLLLGLGAGDVVVHPRAAYPTYEVGARLVGASPAPVDDPADWPDGTRLVWVNSPGNPDGRVLDVAALAGVVRAARARGAVVASDECYAELGWDGSRIPSVLDPDVAGEDLTGLLSVYSLSKQSNLAGYRGAFVAGDPALVARLVDARKHLGLLPPAPVQVAMAAALGDDEHVHVQRERYAARRTRLVQAVEAAGFRLDGSGAGLFLWITEGRDAWSTIDRLASVGILAAPGTFYGSAFPQHVRLSLTATDEAIDRAAERLGAWSLTSSGSA